MKTSNLFITILFLVIVIAMFITNVSLKNEFLKIDLKDVYKNYVLVDAEPYSVLSISGSNGYPIEVVQKETNTIKVLRSRLKHFKSVVKNDTLFINFSGSNIPMNQQNNSKTPAGIIIENNSLSDIITTNIHNRIKGFVNQDLKITLRGKTFTEISNTNLNFMDLVINDISRIDFSDKNKVDSLDLKMNDNSVAYLKAITFRKINTKVKDSATIILSKNTFNKILK